MQGSWLSPEGLHYGKVELEGSFRLIIFDEGVKQPPIGTIKLLFGWSFVAQQADGLLEQGRSHLTVVAHGPADAGQNQQARCANPRQCCLQPLQGRVGVAEP